ncbi:MAG TPA: hypothetical protein PJ986_18815 [Gammaproteobacteria bacterium]|nr:hypothetical protein [Gammaproteobacteria bacterium]
MPRSPLARSRAMLAALLLAAAPPLAAQAPPLDVPLAFVGEATGAAHQGAEQGLAEAQLQGEFLGQRYRLDAAPEEAIAIVAALPAAELQALAAAHPNVPVLNVAADDDALRDHCRANLFHVLPSARMAADALAQWHKAHPEAHGVVARAWHPAFEKYAASQLNKRYTEQFKQPMDDRAWAGWAAVKLVSDTVAREQAASAEVLLDALRNRLAFDGQKGIDMSFRSDGQLRQPLLLVAGEQIVGEAPVRGVVDIEDLDSLGPARCSAP